MDVIKTRLMTDTAVTIGIKPTTVIGAAKQIYTEEGALTFFSGSTPRLMHKIPVSLS